MSFHFMARRASESTPKQDMTTSSHWFDARSSLSVDDLAACAAHNELEHGEELITAGADVNKPGPLGRPLRVASALGHLAFCELLLDNGADVNADDTYGNALHAAAMYGHHQIVDLLIEHDADIDQRGGRYVSAIQAAAVHGHTNVIDILLNSHDAISEFGFARDILHAAVEGNQVVTLRTLLERGHSFADVSSGFFSFKAPALPRNILRDTCPPRARLKRAYQDHRIETDPLDPTPDLRSCKDITQGNCNYALVCAATHDHLDVMKVLVEHRDGPAKHLFSNETIFRALQAAIPRSLRRLSSVYGYLLEIFPLDRPHRIKLLGFALDQDALCVASHMLELTQLNIDEFQLALMQVKSDSGYELILEQIKGALSPSITDNLLVDHFERVVRQGHVNTVRSLLATYPHILKDQLQRALQIALWGDVPSTAVPLLEAINITKTSRDLLLDLAMTASACDIVPILDVLAQYMLAVLTKDDITEVLYSSCIDGRAETVHFLVRDGRFTNVITPATLNTACENALRSGHYAICATLLDLSITSGKYFGWTSQDSGWRSIRLLPAVWPVSTTPALRRARRYVQGLEKAGGKHSDMPRLPEKLGAHREELNCVRRMSELMTSNHRHATIESSDNELSALVQYLASWDVLHQLQYAAELGHCGLLTVLLTRIGLHKENGVIAEVLYRVACLERGCALPGKLLLDKLVSNGGKIDTRRLLEGVLGHLQSEDNRNEGLLVNTPTIAEALQHGPPALLKHILGLMPEMKAVGSSYALALQLAAAGGDNTLIKLLVLRGLSPDSICGYYGTALQAAATFGQLQSVDLLLKLGADPDIRAGEHDYPLRAAVLAGQARIVDRLIAAGATLDLAKDDEAGFSLATALGCALRLEDSSIALRLISLGASVHRIPGACCLIGGHSCTIDADVLLAAIRKGVLRNDDGCRGSHGRPCWRPAATHAAQARRFDFLEIVMQYTGVYFDKATGYNVLYELFNSRSYRRTKRYKQILHGVLRSLDERYQLSSALNAALEKSTPRLADLEDTLGYIDCPPQVMIRACELGKLDIVDYCFHKLDEPACRRACEDGFLAAIRFGRIEVVQGLLGHTRLRLLLAEDDLAPQAIGEAFQACADNTLFSLPWQPEKETAAKARRSTHDFASQLSTTTPRWSSQNPHVRKYEVIIVTLLEHEFLLPDEARFGCLMHLTAFLGMPLLFDRLRRPDEDFKSASRYFPDCVTAAEEGGQTFMVERISALLADERGPVDNDVPIHRAALNKDWTMVYTLAANLKSTRERDEQGRSALTICLQYHESGQKNDTYQKAVLSLLDKTYGFDDKDLDYAFCLPDTDETAELKAKVLSRILERNRWLTVSPENFGRVKDWNGKYKGLLQSVIEERRMTKVTTEMIVRVQDIDLVRQLLRRARGCVFTTDTLDAVLLQWPSQGEDCVVLLLAQDRHLVPDESNISKVMQSTTIARDHKVLGIMLQRRQEFRVSFDPKWLHEAKSACQLRTLLQYTGKQNQVDFDVLEALLANMAYTIASSEQLYGILSLEGAHITTELADKILCRSPGPAELLDLLFEHVPELEISDNALSNIIRSDITAEEHSYVIKTLKKHDKPVVMTATVKHALNKQWPDGDIHGPKQMYWEYCFSDASLEVDPICDEHCTGQDCIWRM